MIRDERTAAYSGILRKTIDELLDLIVIQSYVLHRTGISIWTM